MHKNDKRVQIEETYTKLMYYYLLFAHTKKVTTHLDSTRELDQ